MLTLAKTVCAISLSKNTLKLKTEAEKELFNALFYFKQKNSRPCCRIVLGLVIVIAVICVAGVAWKLYDLQKAIAENENRIHNLLTGKLILFA